MATLGPAAHALYDAGVALARKRWRCVRRDAGVAAHAGVV
ncbi:hypothetical protein SDC9_147691 [bioreactor metagenome]|uniref:Uncharacterized protein n=1 Tax=bioreactor metagenome TaxID=1076179 RepID=A0A645EGC6_9ZZZZ